MLFRIPRNTDAELRMPRTQKRNQFSCITKTIRDRFEKLFAARRIAAQRHDMLKALRHQFVC
jgi:hypothetical protein